MDELGAPFGSEEWVRQSLVNALLRARVLVDEAHRAAAVNGEGVDFDAYAFVVVPRHQRKVWKFLVQIAAEFSWIALGENTVDLKPSVQVDGFAAKRAEGPAADAVAALFRSIGIEATVSRSYR